MDNKQNIEKLDMSTPNITDDNVARIAELFPNVVTEGRDENGKLTHVVDFDTLKQELSNSIVEGPQERYRLDWPGKREAMLAANTPITKTLRPVREESVDFDTTKNLFIEGDNLDALKLLQETYLGKVKMIYIDPPYNTGKDFIYKDNFTGDKQEYLEGSGQVDEEGGKLVANPESNGRYHSDWLSMMYPRLKLARNLLRDDGIIFISIDHNEAKNLSNLVEELLGEQNELVPFIWSLPRGINAGHISKSHEYLLGFAKNKEKLPLFKKVGDASFSIDRCNKKIDRRHPASKINFPEGIPYYGKDQVLTGAIEGSEKIIIHGELVFKNGKLAKSVTLEAGWTMKNMIELWIKGEKVIDSKGQEVVEFFFKENGKLYSRKKSKFESPKSILKNVPDNQAARIEIEQLFGSQDIFNYPKPSGLLERLINYVASDDDIILDFFAGSASTAQGAFQASIDKSHSTKFILVQLPEAILDTDVDNHAALEFCKKSKVPNTIAEISKERIRRAGKKILKENPDQVGKLDIGFRVLKIDSSNMNDVYYSPVELEQASLLDAVEHIKPDRTAEDLLFQVMLDWGVDLSLLIIREVIGGKTVFWVGENDLAACFDLEINEDIVKAMAERKPLRAVFRDDGFGSDDMKINAGQLFAQMTDGHTDMKVI